MRRRQSRAEAGIQAPRESGGDNRVEIVRGAPAKDTASQRGAGDEFGRIARPRIGWTPWNRPPADALDRRQDLQH